MIDETQDHSHQGQVSFIDCFVDDSLKIHNQFFHVFRLREENALTLNVHCYAHIPNLCLVDLSKQVIYVRNSFASLQSLLFCE